MIRLVLPTDAEIQEALLTARLHRPDHVVELAQGRKRRTHLTNTGRLVIVAADHPARRVTAAGGDPWAMARRADLLRRLVRVLMQPGVDGVLATPDIMEELFILNEWLSSQGIPDFLGEKVLIGSMNRAGLAGAVFELDDFVTGYTAAALSRMNLDGGKLLLRVDLNARDTARTIRYCVEALSALAEFNLPAFLEPLAVPSSVDDLVRLVGVASALGPTSVRRWLKLPMCEAFERVAEATTCPILLLGGDFRGDMQELLTSVERCLGAGPNVCGVMIGRGILYPADGSDPAERAAQLAAVVHGSFVREMRS